MWMSMKLDKGNMKPITQDMVYGMRFMPSIILHQMGVTMTVIENAGGMKCHLQDGLK